MEKLKTIQHIITLCSHMIELVNNGNVIVPHDDVEALVNLGNFFGLIVFGGAFIEDDKQCLYID